MFDFDDLAKTIETQLRLDIETCVSLGTLALLGLSVLILSFWSVAR